MIVDALLQRLDGVNSVELVCQPELEGFYAQWGFTAQIGRSRLLRRSEDASLVG
jgi:predicted GNAT family N-acyltransferase